MSLDCPAGQNVYVGTSVIAHHTLLPPVGFPTLHCPHGLMVHTGLGCLLRPQSTLPSQPPKLTYSLLIHAVCPYLWNDLPSPPCLVHFDASFKTWLKQVLSYTSIHPAFFPFFFFVTCSFSFYVPSIYFNTHWLSYLILSLPLGHTCDVGRDCSCLADSY